MSREQQSVDTRPSALLSDFLLRLSAPLRMLRVRKRCVNWLYLTISWSGPCRPVFLGPARGGEGRETTETSRTDESRGLTWKGIPEEWKGSTGKWVSLCRSRATGHAPRLPSSLLFAGGSSSGPSPRPQSKGDQRAKKGKRGRSSGTHGHGTDRAPRS